MEQTTTKELAAQLRPVLTRLTRKLRKVSPQSGLLSQNERAVLVLLEQHDSLLSSEMATIEGITAQSMGAILKNLFALELISKKPSKTDKRKIYISISSKGKKLIAQVRKEREDWLIAAIEKVCTEKDRVILLKAIVPLNKLLEAN
jgi:DNA-binding MarR family transcriptional regulator